MNAETESSYEVSNRIRKRVFDRKKMKAESERIIKFIKEYVKQSGRKGIVLGLSGGLDSAVVAVLAKRALDGNNIHCYYLPMIDEKGNFDKDHIENLCKRYDLTYRTKEIMMDVEGIVDDSLNGITRVAYGNIKARIRMAILYQYANRINCLVVGTTNKSEWMIGYFTKHGDGGADLKPIQHLYKTQVYDLAKYLDIPNEIVDKPPTAGLWDGQTDECELGMSYSYLDEILQFIEKHQLIEKEDSNYTTEGLDIKKEDIDRVIDMINKSKHKRKLPAMMEVNDYE